MTNVKIALITGATRGIGYETARQLADLGVHVILSGRCPVRVEQAVKKCMLEGLSVEGCIIDVTDEQTIVAAAEWAQDKYGRVDILVNNAAIRIEEYGRKPSQQSIQDWNKTFQTNLFGIVAVTKAFLPLLCKSQSGRIVNVSSLLASLGTHTNPDSYAYSDTFKSLPAYSASKSALNSWTIHLAYELRGTPIKVNSVHPGYTRTDMNDGAGDISIEDGARTSVAMAMLGFDGETGSYVHMGEVLPW